MEQTVQQTPEQQTQPAPTLEDVGKTVRQLPPLPKEKVEWVRKQAEEGVKKELEGLWNPERAIQARNIFLTNALAQMEDPDSPFRQMMTALLPKQNAELAQIRNLQLEANKIKATIENLIADTGLKDALRKKALEEIDQLKKNTDLDERKVRIAEAMAISNIYQTVAEIYTNYAKAAGDSIGLFSKQYTDALDAVAKLTTAMKDAPAETKAQIGSIVKNLSIKLGLPEVILSSGFLGLGLWRSQQEKPPVKEYQELWEGGKRKQGPNPLPGLGDIYTPGVGVNVDEVAAALQRLNPRASPTPVSPEATKKFLEALEQIRKRAAE